MADLPANHDRAALFDEPIDPRQFAMHGLLRIYYEGAADRSQQRINAILMQAKRHGFQQTGSPVGSTSLIDSSSRLPRYRFPTLVTRRWALGIGSLAVAATLIFAVSHFLFVTPKVAADEALLRAAAMQVILLPTSVDPFMDEDPKAYQTRLDEIEGFRRQRDAALAQSRQETDPAKRNQAAHDAMEPWAQTYRHLRNLGRFEEARKEIAAASAFAKSPGYGHTFDSWRDITTADLGFLDLSLGNYGAAKEAFLASIETRFAGYGEFGDPSLYGPSNQGHVSTHIPPMYWALSTVCLAEGKIVNARQWQDRADHVLGDYYRAVCRKNGITISDVATALDASDAAPVEFRNPKILYEPQAVQDALKTYHGFCPDTTHTTLLRVHLYHEALLRLHENDVEGARHALARGIAISFNEFHDEYRLPFAEPLLAARIAIVDGQYDQALMGLSKAEANIGALEIFDSEGRVLPKPAVPSTRLAELRLLRALALLGKDENSTEGRSLVEKALTVPAKLAAGLSVEQRAVFMKQFDSWRAAAAQTLENKP